MTIERTCWYPPPPFSLPDEPNGICLVHAFTGPPTEEEMRREEDAYRWLMKSTQRLLGISLEDTQQ